jgi:hypothetical protein
VTGVDDSRGETAARTSSARPTMASSQPNYLAEAQPTWQVWESSGQLTRSGIHRGR